MNKLNSIRFRDIEKFFKSEILTGEVSACKRITIKTEKGDLILQIGDTEDHYYVDLVNKPVETTKEQPKIDKDLKIKIMNIMTKHVDLRNSDKITDKDLYHSFLDWEKEVWEVLLG